MPPVRPDERDGSKYASRLPGGGKARSGSWRSCTNLSHSLHGRERMMNGASQSARACMRACVCEQVRASCKPLRPLHAAAHLLSCEASDQREHAPPCKTLHKQDAWHYFGKGRSTNERMHSRHDARTKTLMWPLRSTLCTAAEKRGRMPWVQGGWQRRGLPCMMRVALFQNSICSCSSLCAHAVGVSGWGHSKGSSLCAHAVGVSGWGHSKGC
jgi:hypothetical protein